MLYKYTSFQHALEIRLLRLQNLVHDAELKVTISPARLDEHPIYRAVSYAWGDTTTTRIINCNDGEGRLSITANCELALRRLGRDDEEIPIWIDSVCIDQNNVTERNQQLLLMSDIYRLASKVQVHLGDEDGDSALGMGYFRDPKKFSNRPEEPWVGLLHASDIAVRPRQAVNGILSRTWFERIWVLQEVLVSSSVEVLCGDLKVTWSELTTAIFGWGGRNRIFLKEGIKEPPILFRFAENGSRDMGDILLRYMHEARKSKSTDPRDRIYALLGLAVDVASGNNPFRPDTPSELRKSRLLRGMFLPLNYLQSF